MESNGRGMPDNNDIYCKTFEQQSKDDEYDLKGLNSGLGTFSIEDFIIKSLINSPKDRLILLMIEQELLSFFNNEIKIMKFPEMTSYNRMLVHRVAEYFALEHNVDLAGNSVIVSKNPSSKLPPLSFQELLGNYQLQNVEDSPQLEATLPVVRAILKREIKADTGVQSVSSSKQDCFVKTLEKREAEYQLARERIFKDLDSVSVTCEISQKLKEDIASISTEDLKAIISDYKHASEPGNNKSTTNENRNEFADLTLLSNASLDKARNAQLVESFKQMCIEKSKLDPSSLISTVTENSVIDPDTCIQNLKYCQTNSQFKYDASKSICKTSLNTPFNSFTKRTGLAYADLRPSSSKLSGQVVYSPYSRNATIVPAPIPLRPIHPPFFNPQAPLNLNNPTSLLPNNNLNAAMIYNNNKNNNFITNNNALTINKGPGVPRLLAPYHPLANYLPQMNVDITIPHNLNNVNNTTNNIFTTLNNFNNGPFLQSFDNMKQGFNPVENWNKNIFQNIPPGLNIPAVNNNNNNLKPYSLLGPAPAGFVPPPSPNSILKMKSLPQTNTQTANVEQQSQKFISPFTFPNHLTNNVVHNFPNLLHQQAQIPLVSTFTNNNNNNNPKNINININNLKPMPFMAPPMPPLNIPPPPPFMLMHQNVPSRFPPMQSSLNPNAAKNNGKKHNSSMIHHHGAAKTIPEKKKKKNKLGNKAHTITNDHEVAKKILARGESITLERK